MADSFAVPDGDGEKATDGSSLEEWLETALPNSSRDASEMIEAHRRYLLLVANHELDPRLRGKVAPSDAVQESFALAQKRFSTFRGTTENELQAWLRQILLNHICDLRRRLAAAAKRSVDREAPIAGDSAAGQRPIDPGCQNTTPRTAAIEQEEAELLRSAISRLPEDYRQVIMLRSWQRLRFEEVGQQMGRSAGAARKLWGRAVDALRNELGDLDLE